MDLSYLEQNCGQNSMVLLHLYEQILGIEVNPTTTYRYNVMMNARLVENKRKQSTEYKNRKKKLKKVAMRVHTKRTTEASVQKKLTYKQPAPEQVACFIFMFLKLVNHYYGCIMLLLSVLLLIYIILGVLFSFCDR